LSSPKLGEAEKHGHNTNYSEARVHRGCVRVGHNFWESIVGIEDVEVDLPTDSLEAAFPKQAERRDGWRRGRSEAAEEVEGEEAERSATFAISEHRRPAQFDWLSWLWSDRFQSSA
jgi:hypothetical protein